MNITINNGRIIDPVNQRDEVTNLYVADGRVVGIGEEPNNFVAELTIDATNQLVMPGFVDLNASLREPGFEQKATIKSETKAATAAGYTTLCCLPNTQPVLDTPAVAQLILDKAELAGFATVLPLGALTIGLEGKALTEVNALKKAGCIALSQAPNSVIDSHVIRRALQYASTHDMLVMLKPEDALIRGDGCAHDGAMSTRLGLPGIPTSAETVAIAQIIELTQETGARVHLTGLSSARAVAMVARAQFDQIPITADVHAHQLDLTDQDIGAFDANYHTSPPLRSVEDKEALVAALAAGTVVVSSGHRPHEDEVKQAPFTATESGISSLETVLPLMLRLVNNGAIDVSAMVERLACNPASILGLDTGGLSNHAVANITIVDPAANWVVDEATWCSSGLNTPYWHQQMTGCVTHTLVNGNLVF